MVLSGFFPVFDGTDPLNPAETLGKIAGGRKAQGFCDFRKGGPGFREQIEALFDPAGKQVVNG